MNSALLADRRAFLRRIGIGLAAAPFVPLLEAQAARKAPPRRLIILHSNDGTGGIDNWNPTGTEHDFRLGPIMAPLESIKRDLICFDGFWDAMRAGGHPRCVAQMLTGTRAFVPPNDRDTGASPDVRAESISVDQFIARQIGRDTLVESLQLGCCSDPDYGAEGVGTAAISYRDRRDPMLAEMNPYVTYDRLFGRPGAAPTHGDTRSVLDAVKDDLSALKRHMGVSDGRKMDGHLEAIRGIERALDRRTGAAARLSPSCSFPPRDERPGDWYEQTASIPAVGKLNIDMLVAAMACDLTRVATLQISVSNSPVVPVWLGKHEGKHSVSHSNDTAWMAEYHRWVADDLFRTLIEKLKAIPEGNGTLLDNSAVVWMNEFSDVRTHLNQPIPILAAGRAGGAWKTGRFIKFPEFRPHSDFLLSLCHAMGLENETFGLANQGPVGELGG